MDDRSPNESGERQYAKGAANRHFNHTVWDFLGRSPDPAPSGRAEGLGGKPSKPPSWSVKVVTNMPRPEPTPTSTPSTAFREVDGARWQTRIGIKLLSAMPPSNLKAWPDKGGPDI
jgi:hypothetical protein